ncbi:MAG TPA: hypothetical protein PKJ12_02035, partial [Ottowia sp.]|nr:hypothetical protein [Ottowia sp.]
MTEPVNLELAQLARLDFDDADGGGALPPGGAEAGAAGEPGTAALDAAVLAASSHLGLPTQDTIGRAKAQAFFRENLRHGSEAELKDEDLIFDVTEGSVSARANSVLPTTMMRAFQRNSLTVGAASTVRKGQG